MRIVQAGHGPLPQNLPHGQEIHHNGHSRAQDVGQGLGVESGPGPKSRGQSEDGHKVHQLPPEGQGQGKPHLADTRKAVHQLVLHSQGDDGQESGATAQEATPAPSQSSQSGAGITEDEARSIALEHAGVTAEEATVYRVKADYEDGRAVYDVEFAVGATEYDYEIAQEDGAVLSYDSDVEGWTPVSGENQTSSQGAGPVSQEEATQLVLDRVPGAAESDVRIRLDRDDGREVYEGELYYDRTEYEFEIDASTGSFLEWSADSGR